MCLRMLLLDEALVDVPQNDAPVDVLLTAVPVYMPYNLLYSPFWLVKI